MKIFYHNIYQDVAESYHGLAQLLADTGQIEQARE